ncbi:uncharacterized protein LOC142319020 [Lycorma delicatula]|uniref:uncharacterized protein LOC142319020 n=1 Tax=Lycorma delicatula TaxID=130591 RepID=UPI003F514BB6
MAVNIPTWLTKDYIRTALQNDENTKNIISIEKMEVDTPVPVGNNGTCLIIRVQAFYFIKDEKDVQKISFILKAPMKSELHEFISEGGVYQKESMIYSELVPKYKSMFKDVSPDLFAKSFYSTEKDVVILEDLKVKGYMMADKAKQLSFEECAVALSSLAIFHAASVKLYETEPELIKKVSVEILFREDTKEYFTGITEGFIHRAGDEFEKHPELRKYVESIRKVEKRIFDELVQLCKPKESEFNVLNHGDFWTNNMMFKYIDNKPVHVIPIDLQACRYATPALDIVYFMYSSAKEEVRTEKYDDLLNIYLNKLNKYLEIFRSEKRLNITELKNAIDECGILAVQVTIAFLPFFLVDSDKTEIIDVREMSIEEFKNSGSGNNMDGYFRNNKYLKIIEKRFEEFENNRWYLKT